jgi:uncharacterized membrane protein
MQLREPLSNWRMTMTWLLLGLFLFLATHSLRMLAPGLRFEMIGRLGEMGWKALFSVISLLSFGMLIYGYAQARLDPSILWVPPVWTRHLASLLTLPAFMLLVAAYVPGNHFKARIGHPMYAAVKLWALAHLLANGALHDLLLFGSFLIWAVAGFISGRRRDRAESWRPGPGRWLSTLAVIVAGAGLWVVFALFLHARWIGVAPFG